MDIQVGEYVRNNKGKIRKVISTYFKHGLLDRMMTDKGAFYCEDEVIIKHSFNIIDLIEVGDFVNGQEVIEIRKQDGKIYLMTGYVPQAYIKKDIKSIVTKEQFAIAEYRLEA